MKISALIITYNRRAHICRAINSILAQDSPLDEVIVVDDGSTDETAQLLAETYGGRLRIVQQENLGVSSARRRAVREASGAWVAFLDSDDEWTPGRNRIFRKMIESIPKDVGCIFGDTAIVRDNGVSGTIFATYAQHMDLAPRVLENSMSVQLPFQLGLIQSSIYLRDSLLAVDCFSEGLTHSEDFLVGVQVACLYRLALVPEVVTSLYRTSELETSSQDIRARGSEDYFAARMIASRAAIQSGHKRPWDTLYEESVRALCQVNASKGKPAFQLAREQFRFGVSTKSVLFFCATLGGNLGISTWNGLAKGLRNVLSLVRRKNEAEQRPLL